MQVVYIVHDHITQSVLQLGCAVLCCAVLCCAVLRCAQSSWSLLYYSCLHHWAYAAACLTTQAYALLVVLYVGLCLVCFAALFA